MQTENSLAISSSLHAFNLSIFSNLYSCSYRLPDFFSFLSLAELKYFLAAINQDLSSLSKDFTPKFPSKHTLTWVDSESRIFHYWKGKQIEIIAYGELLRFSNLSADDSGAIKKGLKQIADIYPQISSQVSPSESEKHLFFSSRSAKLNPAAYPALNPDLNTSPGIFSPIPTPDYLPLLLGCFRYDNLQGKMILPAVIIVRKNNENFLWIGANTPALTSFALELTQHRAATYLPEEKTAVTPRPRFTAPKSQLIAQSCPDSQWCQKVADLSQILKNNSARSFNSATSYEHSSIPGTFSDPNVSTDPHTGSAGLLHSDVSFSSAPNPSSEPTNLAKHSPLSQSQLEKLEKVVLSRSETYLLDGEVPICTCLQEMGNKFPDCWIYKIDDYLGATPEILASVQQGELFCRVLAGSCPPGEENELLHNPKELQEHKIARNSALDKLSPHFPNLTFNPEPKILKLKNISHLASDIITKLNVPQARSIHLPSIPENRLITQLENTHPEKEQHENNQPDLDSKPEKLDLEDALVIAALLHPTAAVCGKDEESAKIYINQYEDLDREYFAGPIGWLNASGEGEWCIALRCAKYHEHTLTFYGGAGIMADSSPEKELKETKRKMEAMKAILLPNL